MSTMASTIRTSLGAVASNNLALAESISNRIATEAVPTATWTRAYVSSTARGARIATAPEAQISIGAQRAESGVLNVAGRSFGMAEIALSTAQSVLGIALVITSALALAREWDSMSDPQRALNVVALTVSTLSAFATETVVAGICAAFEVADATATAAVNAIPIVGQVLAVIGVVLMVIIAIVEATVGKPQAPPPPPDPVVQFIDNVLKELIQQWNSQPQSHIDVSMASGTVPPKEKFGIFQTTITNNSTTSRLQVDKVTFSFKSGAKPACLFSNTEFTAVTKPENTRPEPKNGDVFVDQFADENPCRVVCTRSLDSKGDDESDESQWTYTNMIIVTGVPNDGNPRGVLDFPPRGICRLNIAGLGAGKSIASFEVVEEYGGDSVYHSLTVNPGQARQG
jgi:hypothetical protein